MSSQDREREELEAKLQEYVGVVQGLAEVGPDLVNEPMIRHWCEVLGDRNPIYTDAEAPPTMMQAWILRGFEMADSSRVPDNKQNNLHQLLTDFGYPSVVATNCEQGYTRYLRPGDQVAATTVIESISEQKATALGIGYFINTRTVFRDQNDEEVGWMTFRVLRRAPPLPRCPAGCAPPRATTTPGGGTASSGASC
jgi:acyl dehydratase